MSLDHIIVLMMENHSFDRALGALYPYRADGGGVTGGIQSNQDRTTQPPDNYSQGPTSTREIMLDPGHDLDEVLTQINGGHQGFVTQFATKYPKSTQAQRAEIMGYYEDGSFPVLHALAKNFTVCDRWFSSLPGPTWPNRFFVHSGTSLGHVDMPEGALHLNMHLYDQRTVYQELTQRDINWRIYYGDFPQTLTMTHQLELLDHYEEMSRFFDDTKGPERDFPQYCFIEPSYFGKSPNDQHPPHDVERGEALIAQVYNALRRNDDLWQRSMLVILYDEHGGFYDHVESPEAVPPDAHVETYGFNQLGVRVPAILVSPWVEPGVRSDTFDHTSLLKFAAEKWGFDSNALGARTGAATTNSLSKYILATPRDTKTVLPVVDIPTYLPMQPQTELNSNQRALVALSEHLASKITDEGTKQDLMCRSAEANQGTAPTFDLAIDRLNAFLMDKGKLPASLDPGKMKAGVMRFFGGVFSKTKAPAGGKGTWTGSHSLSFLVLVALILGANIGLAAHAQTSYAMRPGSWVATMVFLIGLLMLVGHGITGRTWGAFIDDRDKMSLSRFQLVVWTLIVVSALLSASIWNEVAPVEKTLEATATGASIHIPSQILYLLGISGTSFVAVPMILQQKAARNANLGEFDATANGLQTQDHPRSAIQHEGQLLTKSDPIFARWTDLFRGDEVGNASVVDMSKVQQFLYTLALGFGYCVAIYRMWAQPGPISAMPNLDGTFVGLLGISHAAYLGYKAAPHSQDAAP